MENEMPAGWELLPPLSTKQYEHWNNERKMLVVSNDGKSTLVKENEIHLEFTGNEHLSEALKKSDEIWAAEYAP